MSVDIAVLRESVKSFFKSVVSVSFNLLLDVLASYLKCNEIATVRVFTCVNFFIKCVISDVNKDLNSVLKCAVFYKYKF